jgi:imidazole glycerol-phosphate synthase subunit HisF
VLGNPGQFARHYYQTGADELLFMDVVASLYERNSLHEIISQTARDIFIPITVGGGLRTLDDIREVLKAGADKVAINTAAVKRPGFISEAAAAFGNSTIVAAIEAIKQPDGSYTAFIDNGREETGLEVVGWAQRLEELGAGEILITSVDRDGTGKGFDQELTETICNGVGIPVIAHGGAGSISDVVNIVTQTQVSAVCIASIIHYGALWGSELEAESAGVPNETGNREFMAKGRGTFHSITGTTIDEVKVALVEHGVDCRSGDGE